MKRFAIVTNPSKDLRGETAEYICKFLQEHDRDCVILEDIQEGEASDEVAAKIPIGTECIVIVGGDGTMIQAARNLIDTGIPMIGVNMGTLGYLTELDTHSLEEGLFRLMETRPMVEHRMMLQGEIVRGNKVICRDIALNDIVLGRKNSLRLIGFMVEVDGEPLKRYAADGMIIATPTGSTAYNLSVGGPIVAPAASLILMTPISPHTMINRSIVLPDTAEITITLMPRKEETEHAIVGFDGRGEVELCEGDRIVIRRSEKETKIFKLSNISFLENLRDKMREV